jgi:CRP/FNR family transcriptional regulator, cyclic AMP receptor protein
MDSALKRPKLHAERIPWESTMEMRTLHEPKPAVARIPAGRPAPTWGPDVQGPTPVSGSQAGWDPSPVFEAHGSPLELRRGTPVYTPGQSPAHIYWISQGEVSLVRHTVDGREFTLDVHREGSVFGEQELLLDMPRHCEAVCRTDTHLVALTAQAVWTQRRESANFAWWLSRVLAERQTRLEARLEALLFKSAPGKVAQVLVDLAQEYGRPSTDGTLIDYPITHQEIGSMIGTTRETVSYAFMDFRQKGLIATRQRRTIVRDLRRLEEAALV